MGDLREILESKIAWALGGVAMKILVKLSRCYADVYAYKDPWRQRFSTWLSLKKQDNKSIPENIMDSQGKKSHESSDKTWHSHLRRHKWFDLNYYYILGTLCEGLRKSIVEGKERIAIRRVDGLMREGLPKELFRVGIDLMTCIKSTILAEGNGDPFLYCCQENPLGSVCRVSLD